jgi:hypothetical protein
MVKRLALIAAVIAVAALAVAPIGAAKPSGDPGKGGRCIAAGVTTLVGAGLIVDAARGTLDYSALAGPNGVRLDLAPGTFLPLSTVIGLHRTNPELFAWCDSV